MLGPLTRLRLYGFCCPCLEGEEENTARVAALTIQFIPIRWYRKVRDTSGTSPGAVAGGIFDGVMRGLCVVVPPRHNDGSDGDEKSPGSTDLATMYVPFDATLSVTDTSKFGPAMEVTCNDPTQKEYEFADENIGITDTHNFLGRTKRLVPLNMMDVASSGDGWENVVTIGGGGCTCNIKIYARPNQHQLLGSGKKLLQFDLNYPTSADEPVFYKVSKQEVIDHINALIQWDRARRSIVEKDLHQRDGETALNKENQPTGGDSIFTLVDDEGKKANENKIVFLS